MRAIESLTLEEIAEAIGGRLTGAGSVSSVSTDTRSLQPGSLFVALKGPSHDGHDFVEAALSAGASCLLVEREVEGDVPCIIVPDTLRAIQALAALMFKRARENGMRSVAVTGSNGKTTVKEMLGALFLASGRDVYVTPGNFNNHIGLPLTITNAPAPGPNTVWVLEMGANQFGDIRELIEIAPADCRVVTSIGASHLEKLGDLDGVRRVKSEIFEHSTRDTCAVMPFDEAERLNLKSFQGRVYTVGQAQSSDVRLVRATSSGSGQDVEVSGDSQTARYSLSLPGRHNALNLATSLAALYALREPWPKGGDSLSELELPGGRLRWQELGNWRVLNDTYNANPNSMEASFEAFLDVVPSGKRIAVIGEMRELGKEAKRLHRQTARRIASLGGVDALVFVGSFSSEMGDAAREVQGEASVHEFESVRDVALFLRDHLSEELFLFLKASRGVKLERLLELLKADGVGDVI